MNALRLSYSNTTLFWVFDADRSLGKYDTSLGRRWNVDPVVKEYESPYACFSDNPIYFSDVDGDDPGEGDVLNPTTRTLPTTTILGKKLGFWNWVNRNGAKVMDGVQLGLDVVGMIPALGEIADGANALISLARGDKVGAALSVASMIPFVGWGSGVAKIGKDALKLSNNGRKAAKIATKNADEVVEATTKHADEVAGGACFVKGTLIKTINGDKPIEKISDKDSIYCFDEATGSVVISSVTNHFERLVDTLIYLKIGNSEVWASKEHPFYIGGGWIDAIDINEGDSTLLLDGTKDMVHHKVVYDSVSKVYNFLVPKYHNYYVTSDGILVHNPNGCGADAGGTRRKNRLSNEGEPNTMETNGPGTTTKKYGHDGQVQKEYNKGHPDHPEGSIEGDEHVHDYIPGQGNKGRQPARKPKPNEMAKDRVKTNSN